MEDVDDVEAFELVELSVGRGRTDGDKDECGNETCGVGGRKSSSIGGLGEGGS
jgi:hypothetical protein